MKIKGFLLCLCAVIETCKASVITIATYNLWNVMFNWDVRKQYIARKLSQFSFDVAAFQEVRSHRRSSWSQLHELQELLPSYKWLLYQSVQEVIPPKYGAPSGWEMEGLGILSRLPITHHALQSLVQDSRLDKNKRVVLHANVSLSGGKSFNVSVVHLSSDRRQQCSNVAQILNHLKDHTTACSVILGDFNTYNDYEWPMLALQEGKISSINKCYISLQQYASLEKVQSYVDVWKQANPAKQGYTFSNMGANDYFSKLVESLKVELKMDIILC
ncbi:uncharacterized protein LOC117123130 isoform X2 [Anneissia japonica]|uniref:uncharacterized protein LOC117123130 isoform X2 n=1 Tax=Anneissia japonica TaxID=1529436 RepID=UPI0014258A95|nr:uncharacterized protein LOC117123130 isoform X2 [Anneissia japonica]